MNWIDCGLTFEEFKDTPACRPGVLIDVPHHSTGASQLLSVGDVNVVGGGCGCCSPYDQDVVTRYASVWTMPEVPS